MRLLFTGRVVRARRKLLTLPVHMQNSKAHVNTSREQTTSTSPSQGVLYRPFEDTEDIHPASTEPSQISSQPPSSDSAPPGKIEISHTTYPLDSTSNTPPSILKLLNRCLYNQLDHPITITRNLIEKVFPGPHFQNYIASHPVVSTAKNFDALGFPLDHPGRSTTDTYYINAHNVLRTHTSAHQHSAFASLALARRSRTDGYTICADVFRRDSIDRSHFPVFHQMEGARVWWPGQRADNGSRLSMWETVKERRARIAADIDALGEPPVDVSDPHPVFDESENPMQRSHDRTETRLLTKHLKRSLEWLVVHIFEEARASRIAADPSGPDSPPLQVRWVPAYFPFTAPSWELEVFWQGEWLELLGCGVVQQALLHNAGAGDAIGWAWGLGVERLAMLLFDIPDIRLFWSEDERFLGQFRRGNVVRFKEFSKYPACYKDVAFWIDPPVPAKEEKIGVAETKTEISLNAEVRESAPISAAGGNIPSSSSSSSSPPIGASASSPTTSPSSPTAPPFHENDMMETIRSIAGSLAEDVKLVDSFTHPSTGRRSRCYRINYRSLERTLTNEEVNALHARIVEGVGGLGVELR